MILFLFELLHLGYMNSETRNKNLDGLRATSVILVIFAHSKIKWVPGGLGVTIFFVLSGYIITKILYLEFIKFGSINWVNFYMRRFWKIFPPVFFILILPSFIFWNYCKIQKQIFISQIFFYYNWIQVSVGSKGVLPGSAVIWSLSIEEQFYIFIAITGFLVTLGEKKLFKLKLVLLYLSLWFFSTISRILVSLHNSDLDNYDETGNLPRIYYGTDTRMSSICVGALIALLTLNWLPRKDQVKRQNLVFLVLGSIGFLFSLIIRDLHFRDSFRYTVQELSIAFVIISGPVLGKWPKLLNAFMNSRSIQMIGRASYSIYLSHLSIIYLVEQKMFIKNNLSYYAKVAILISLSLIIGIVLHRITDAPFENMRQKYRRVH